MDIVSLFFKSFYKFTRNFIIIITIYYRLRKQSAISIVKTAVSSLLPRIGDLSLSG